MKVFIIETVDGILGVFKTLEEAKNHVENVLFFPSEKIQEIEKYTDGSIKIRTFTESYGNYSYVISEYTIGEGRKYK